jgi:hypothetical protein
LLMVGRCEKLAMDCGELPLLCWFVKAAFSWLLLIIFMESAMILCFV